MFFVSVFHLSVPNFYEIQAHLCKVRKIFATLAKIRKEMKEVRDIAGIALPFVIGTAVSAYAGGGFLYSTAILITILILYSIHRHSLAMTWSMIICCMFMCGLLAGYTDSQMSYSRIDGGGLLMTKILTFGESMKNAIDAIPFDNDRTRFIAKALITGERSNIPDEVAKAFRESGGSHILALSGLHLGIIYAIVRFITRVYGNTRNSKILRSFTIISICGFYTLATGAGASVTRAFIFIIIGEWARLSGRPSGLKRIMMAALLIHLSLSPSSIRNVGFQLSYAAVAGIAYIFPWLQGFWPGNRHDDAVLTKCARWIWNSAAMSIACQITTGPIAYIYFGTFPSQFILTNLIALPLTGLIIPMTLLTLAANQSGICIRMLTDCTEWLVTALCESLSLLSTM